MALITKIREKSGLAVGFIAVSLILFIVGSDLIGSNGLFGGSSDQIVGEIAGEKILYPDFQTKLAEATQNFQQGAQRSPTEQEQLQLRQQVWDRMINDIAYQKEFDALGLTISDEELVDMVQGKNVHSAIKQQFVNQQTGVFDKNMVIQFLKNFKTMKPEQQAAWTSFEKNLAVSRLREKYENLMAMSSNVTSLQAKRDYLVQTEKVDAKYLYIPFASIVDSTIKVTDSQLEDYLSSHKDKFKGFNSRSLQYVVFPVTPTKDDSASFYNQIKDLAKGLGAAKNDSAYAASNSDLRSPGSWSLTELPESIKNSLSTFNVGGIYGPFKDGANYSVVKYNGTSKDSLFSIRASHILFQFGAKTDSAKAATRAKAEAVLQQIKGGANFETMAQINGSDGTAQKGGDLGYFKNNGSMVKPFEKALFGYNGAGLLPSLVETEFGFHIAKVTEAKSNTKYKISVISKVIGASQETREVEFGKAEKFASENRSLEALKKAATKDKLISLTAERVQEGANSINAMQNAREIVRWAFDTKNDVNDVSTAFEVNDSYLVAAVTAKSSKDKPSINDFRDELKYKVLAQLKGDQILKKLETVKGNTLEQIAQKYGAGALVETAVGISLANGTLNSAGQDATALGKAFGLKTGKKSPPFKGESGVFIVEGGKLTPAPAIADYTQYKNQGLQAVKGAASYYIGESIKDNAKIVDNLAKMF